MDIETITKLLDAGYTKTDIDKLQGTDGAGSKDNENAGKENPSKNKEQSNADSENESAVNVSDTIKALSDTVKDLSETVKALQENNIKSATGGKTSVDTVGETMKSFIEKL